MRQTVVIQDGKVLTASETVTQFTVRPDNAIEITFGGEVIGPGDIVCIEPEHAKSLLRTLTDFMANNGHIV